MKIYGIYSAGGFGREVDNFLATQLCEQEKHPYQIVFIDDDPAVSGQQIHGYDVMTYNAFLQLTDKQINVAFASPALRRAKVAQVTRDELSFFSIRAASLHLGPGVEIGEGAIFAHNTIVTCDAKIGAHFHCNMFSYVTHDCVVGDFVTFAARVSLNGRIVVEDDVYIGSDATILPGKIDRPLTIGKGAIIGAGAVVTRDVEPGTTVVGSPARPLK
ncbi:NeuD/PglB/VioB family sugar acetyltransferase [Loktanella agnita]|uniref:NeuD/PglB/VioB family sugar acetyltransferase n=1 Tax=Loktanella agnita TaxID=287097 RepID=UPI0039870F8B